MVNAQDEGAGVLVHLKPHREDVRFKGLDAQPMAYWRVLWCPGPPEARQDEGEHIQIRLMPSMMSSSWWIASRFQIKGADLEQDVAVRKSRSLVHSELSSDMYTSYTRVLILLVCSQLVCIDESSYGGTLGGQGCTSVRRQGYRVLLLHQSREYESMDVLWLELRTSITRVVLANTLASSTPTPQQYAQYERVCICKILCILRLVLQQQNYIYAFYAQLDQQYPLVLLVVAILGILASRCTTSRMHITS